MKKAKTVVHRGVTFIFKSGNVPCEHDLDEILNLYEFRERYKVKRNREAIGIIEHMKGGCPMETILTSHKMRFYPNKEQI